MTCTTSNVLPYTDAFGGALLLLWTGIQVAAGDERAQVPIALAGGALTAVLLASAGVGMTRVAECRQAKEKEIVNPLPPPRAPPVTAPALPAPY